MLWGHKLRVAGGRAAPRSDGDGPLGLWRRH